MDWLISWIVKKCIEAINEVYKYLSVSVTSFFDSALIIDIVEVFKYAGLVMYAIASLMAFAQLQEQIASGDSPNIFAFGKNIFLGIVFILINPVLMYLFIKVNELSLIATTGLVSSIKNPDWTTLFTGSLGIIQTLFVLVFLICAIKLLWDTVKRVGMVILYVVCNYFGVIGVTTGNYNFVFSTTSKFTGLCVTHFLQSVFFFGAVTSLVSHANKGLASLTDMSMLSQAFFLIVLSLSITKVVDVIFSTGSGQRGSMAQTLSSTSQSLMILKAVRAG